MPTSANDQKITNATEQLHPAHYLHYEVSFHRSRVLLAGILPGIGALIFTMSSQSQKGASEEILQPPTILIQSPTILIQSPTILIQSPTTLIHPPPQPG